MWSELLLPEQDEALRFLVQRLQDGGGAGLYSEQGTGKTYISLSLLEQLLPVLFDVLIVADLTSLDLTWAERIVATMPQYTLFRDWETFRDARRAALRQEVTTLQPNPAKRTRSQDSQGATPTQRQRRILLLHYELFEKLSIKLSRVHNLWDLVLIDELQKMKARGSNRSRAARRVRTAKRRLGLSGTPLDKTPIDIWAQMRFIEPTALGDDWTDFAEEYCWPAGFKGYKWRFRPSKRPKFMERIKPHIFRLSKGFLNLPPLKIHLEPVQLLGRQREIYEEMYDKGFLDLDGQQFKAGLAVTKKVRLSQITGGFIVNDDVIMEVGSAKERRLNTLLSQLTPPIVVFCRYIPELKIIERTALRHFSRVRKLYGEITGNDRTNLIKSFGNGDVDLLACQVRTGGTSIDDLKRSCHLISYSINYSFIDLEQFVARIHRGGQTRETHLWIIYAEHTEDARILRIVDVNKRKIHRNIVVPLEVRQ